MDALPREQLTVGFVKSMYFVVSPCSWRSLASPPSEQLTGIVFENLIFVIYDHALDLIYKEI